MAVNLAILATYKYYDFFVASFAELLESVGLSANIPTLHLVLPVGISFYTFQALSYTIDVYRGKISATKDVVAFFAFISFFPQLVAGPIERATNLLPQFLKKRHFDCGLAVDGLRQILWGLFKKMVIADRCADFVDAIWGNFASYSTPYLVVAAVLFAFQIYGDFSGYSDIAIGTAKLFGIRLMRNFNLPYFSRNVAEFWRRWHISLNTWFVDYLYIPLGGSREGKVKKFRNTAVIFLTSGLWHGANWTFLLWGAYHAILFLPLMAFGSTRLATPVAGYGRRLPSCRETLQIGITFALVVFGWIIFRASSITEFCDFIQAMVSNTNIADFARPGVSRGTLAFIAMMLLIEWVGRGREYAFQMSINSRLVRWAVYLALTLVTLCFQGHQVQFIYFQF